MILGFEKDEDKTNRIHWREWVCDQVWAFTLRGFQPSREFIRIPSQRMSALRNTRKLYMIWVGSAYSILTLWFPFIWWLWNHSAIFIVYAYLFCCKINLLILNISFCTNLSVTSHHCLLKSSIFIDFYFIIYWFILF